MKVSSVSVSMAAVALLAGGIALWPAQAQPAGQPPAQPGATPPTRPVGPRDRAGEPRSEWVEKLRDEAREHPRLGRALIALHEAKDYLEKAPNDLGGHKATSIKACDDAIKELTEAIKFDEKRDDTKGPGRPGRGKPGDAKPGDDKPAGDKPPADKP